MFLNALILFLTWYRIRLVLAEKSQMSYIHIYSALKFELF